MEVNQASLRVALENIVDPDPARRGRMIEFTRCMHATD